MLFRFIFYIVPDQMFCAACSKTIKTNIESYLKNKQHNYQYTTANFKQHKVEIVGLNIDENVLSIDSIAEEIKVDLESTGYDCEKIEYFLNNHESIAVSTQTEVSFLSYGDVFASLALGIGLMLAEHMNFLPNPRYKNGQYIDLAIGVAATMLAVYVGRRHFKNAWRNLNAMDTLISLGTSTAILYSFLILARPPFLKDDNSPTFFSIPLVVFGVLRLSHAIRDKVQSHIEAALDSIEINKKQRPKVVDTYLLEHDEINLLKTSLDLAQFETKLELNVEIDQIQTGSIIRVQAGKIIPIDSIILGTDTYLVRDIMFGNKASQIKKTGDLLYAGAFNVGDKDLILETIVLASETYLTSIYANIEKGETKPNQAIDFIIRYFLYGIIFSTIISTLFWGIFGPPPKINHALQVLFSMLLSACPCGIGLIEINTSIFKMLMLEEGILANEKLFMLNKAKHIVFDKCGTLTKGKYELDHLYSETGEILDDEYLNYVISVEEQIPENERSAIADAIILLKKMRNIPECKNFCSNPMNKGRGGSGIINGNKVTIGNKALLNLEGITIEQKHLEAEKYYTNQNKLCVFFAMEKNIIGYLIFSEVYEVNQELRPGTKEAILYLLKQNKSIHFLTGDSLVRTLIVKEKLSLPEEYSDRIIIAENRTPQEKQCYVRDLKSDGPVIVIGDEINDALALQEADFSIAINALSPIRDEVDFVLNDSFFGFMQLMLLSSIYRASYYTSVFITFFINSLALASAAGVFYPLTHELFDPMISSMAMVTSSLLLMLVMALFQQFGRYKKNQVYSVEQTKTDAGQGFCNYKNILYRKIPIKHHQELELELNPIHQLA